MNNFDITIITPVYNGGKTIERTIKSVLVQKNVNIQYIIIDGNSIDNTISIINNYLDKISLFISERDLGLYDAINKGINLSQSNLIMILNSDDYYIENDILYKYLKAYKKFGDGVYYSRMNIVNNNYSFLYGKPVNTNYSMLKGCLIPHPSTMISKGLYLKYGLYNLNFKIMADYDLLLRFFLEKNIKFYDLNFTSVVFQTGGLSSNFFKNLREAHAVRQNNNINLFLNGLFTTRSLILYLISRGIIFLGIDHFFKKKFFS